MGISVGVRPFGGGSSLDQVRWEEERRRKRVFCIIAIVSVLIALGAVAIFAQAVSDHVGIGVEIIRIAKNDTLYGLGVFKIVRVYPNSSADFAGLRENDIVEYLDDLALNEKITMGHIFLRLVEVKPGEKIWFTIKRVINGKICSVLIGVKKIPIGDRGY